MKKRYQIFSLTDKQIVHYGGDSGSNDFKDYPDTIVCLETYFQFYQLFETLQEAELVLCEYFFDLAYNHSMIVGFYQNQWVSKDEVELLVDKSDVRDSKIEQILT